MLKIILTTLISLVVAEIPPIHEDHLQQVDYIDKLLDAQIFRIVVIIKTNDTDHALLETLSKRTHSLLYPTLCINTPSVSTFNGKYNGKFSYEAIFEESRIYVVFAGDMKNFYSNLENITKIHFWRSRHRMILSFQEGSMDEMKSLFKVCWKKRITNIVFLFAKKTYTYNPFFEIYDLVVDPTNIFEDKYKNMNGYLLKFSMFETAMDLVLTKKKEYIGRDAFLAKTLTHTINASYIYLTPRDGITYGLKFPNGSMTGVFADVATFYTDITINSRLVKLQFENILESTYPHDREDIACLVPKSSKQPEYKKFLILFPVKIWILLGVSLACFNFLWYFSAVETKKEFFKIFFDLIAITLGCSLKDENGTKVRSVIISYRLYIFLLIAAYQGLLTSVLTVPIQLPEINTLADLEQSRLKIIAATRFKDMLMDNVGSTLTTSLVKRITRVPDDPDIDKVIKKRGYYAIILKETFALRAVLDKDNFRSGNKIYRIMKERPMPSQVCYAARYGSPFLPRFNILLRRFQESGLNEYWKETTVHLVQLASQVELEADDHTELKVVTLDNISASYYCLAIGFGCSLLIFIMEQIVFGIKKRRLTK